MEPNIETDIPQDLLCPISLELMKDPVIAADGHTYDRENITQWLKRKKHRTSPLDGSLLSHTNLTENIFARKIIMDFKSKLTEEKKFNELIANLNKCSQQKEEMITHLLEKIDQVNIENLNLKRQLELGSNFTNIDFPNDSNYPNNPDNTLINNKLINNIDEFVNIGQPIKIFSYKSSSTIWGILHNKGRRLYCWTSEKILLIRFKKKKIRINCTFPIKSNYWTYPVNAYKNCLIFGSCPNIIISDNNFNILQKFEEKYLSTTICKLPLCSFAVGLNDGHVKIYSKKNDFSWDYVIDLYKCHSNQVFCLAHISHYLLSSSKDSSISIFSLPEKRVIKILKDNRTINVKSIISLNEDNFVSSSNGEITVWSINQDFKSVITIYIGDMLNQNIYLHKFNDDIFITRSGKEIRIWKLKNKNYTCIYSWKEESIINDLLVDIQKIIVTTTQSNVINTWNISV